MKKIYSKYAFSLLELIIASVLVIIVILGIFSINSVLSNNNQDYGQRYYVRSQTQSTLNHILNNASLAIGSGISIPFIGGVNAIDQGILVGTDTGDISGASLCIHQDINTSTFGLDNYTVNSPASTSPNYTNSRWLCYTWDPTVSGTSYPNQIWYCDMPYTYNFSSVTTQRGSGPCNTAANLNIIHAPVYLGTAATNPFSKTGALPASFNISTGVFAFTLQNCLNNSAPTCTTGTSTDQVNNPSVQLTGSVVPQQEGTQQN